MRRMKLITTALFLITLAGTPALRAAELRVGAATADISPALPVALWGQFELRIARTAATPLSASVVALESSQDGRTVDAAVMVSCDLVGLPNDVLALVRGEVRRRVPELGRQ